MLNIYFKVTIPNIAGINLGSPVHESSVASPRSPSSGYGDHQSLISSPQAGPVQYEMPNQISQDQVVRASMLRIQT